MAGVGAEGRGRRTGLEDSGEGARSSEDGKRRDRGARRTTFFIMRHENPARRRNEDGQGSAGKSPEGEKKKRNKTLEMKKWPRDGRVRRRRRAPRALCGVTRTCGGGLAMPKVHLSLLEEYEARRDEIRRKVAVRTEAWREELARWDDGASGGTAQERHERGAPAVDGTGGATPRRSALAGAKGGCGRIEGTQGDEVGGEAAFEAPAQSAAASRAMARLRDGVAVTKFGRGGPPKERVLVLFEERGASRVEEYVGWRNPRRGRNPLHKIRKLNTPVGMHRRVATHEITALSTGAETGPALRAVHERRLRAADMDRFLSIVADHRSIDVLLPSAELRAAVRPTRAPSPGRPSRRVLPSAASPLLRFSASPLLR